MSNPRPNSCRSPHRRLQLVYLRPQENRPVVRFCSVQSSGGLLDGKGAKRLRTQFFINNSFLLTNSKLCGTRSLFRKERLSRNTILVDFIRYYLLLMRWLEFSKNFSTEMFLTNYRCKTRILTYSDKILLKNRPCKKVC